MLLQGGKEYVCVMQLHADASEDRLRAVMEEFEGEIYQRPPLRSSVKRILRRRTVYYIDYLEKEGQYVLFRTGCEAGTYIRKLVFDIGQVLGCGAHMKELRRTRVGPLTESENRATLGDLADACDAFKEGDERPLKALIQPIEKALTLVPKIVIRDSAVDALCHGADLALPGVLSLSSGITPGRKVAVFTLKGEVVALARALLSTDEIMEEEKGLAAKIERVVMKTGTYPKHWKS